MGSPAAARIGAARIIVLKIGSSLLIDVERRRHRAAWLAGLAEDVARLREDGTQVVIVSSGAVGLGWHHLGIERPQALERKQAAAAVGQSLLMNAWRAAFEPHAITVAQLLLTYGDMEADQRARNARATLATLLAMEALPIVNENDSVATEELRYGDNDRLSAQVAALVEADLLILLSDIDGLYDRHPGEDGAQHLAQVPAITPAIRAMAGGASEDGVGTGGMATKIAAAGIALERGCTTIIASGREPHPLAALQAGSARATVVG